MQMRYSIRDLVLKDTSIKKQDFIIFAVTWWKVSLGANQANDLEPVPFGLCGHFCVYFKQRRVLWHEIYLYERESQVFVFSL